MGGSRESDEARKEDGAMSIVERRGVEKTYRQGKVEVHALQGVDLAVQPGEFLALRSVGLGQDDPAQPDRRPGRADGGAPRSTAPTSAP